jgi:hypothetical protein
MTVPFCSGPARFWADSPAHWSTPRPGWRQYWASPVASYLASLEKVREAGKADSGQLQRSSSGRMPGTPATDTTELERDCAISLCRRARLEIVVNNLSARGQPHLVVGRYIAESAVQGIDAVRYADDVGMKANGHHAP